MRYMRVASRVINAFDVPLERARKCDRFIQPVLLHSRSIRMHSRNRTAAANPRSPAFALGIALTLVACSPVAVTPDSASPDAPTVDAVTVDRGTEVSTFIDAPATCGTGQQSCSGICTNTQSDNANCGACGMSCAAG